MIADEALQFSGNDIIVIASVLLIVAAFAVWRLYYVDTTPPVDPGLTDGAVLVLSDGMVRQVSASAGLLLGDCADVPVNRVLENFLGDNVAEAKEAVHRLEMTGEPVDMMVHASSGRAYELIGTPAGAMIRLVLREAELLETTVREAEEKASAVNRALQSQEWALQTMQGLVDEAPIIAWHRTEDGAVNWSGGEIRTRSGAVSAEQAVDLIVARTKLNRQPVLAGQPQKSRIEIVVNDGAETVSLHVIEIMRPDGNRVGLATDAGTAASAERTLTRFVQTMTETFAHLTVGLAIFDRNQTLALFNPALVQMGQVEPAWLARRPSLRDIIDELRATRRLPELQDFHKWRTRLVNLFENTEAADYEELWHLADGSNIRVLARPHPHGSLAFIFDDVTERMRLEQRYRHSIDLRRATLDGLNEGIAVFGANGLLQFVNQAFHEIWGTDSESIYAAMHARQLITFCEDLTVEDEVWHRLHSFITGEDNRRAWTTRLTMRSQRVLTARFAPLPDGSTMAVFSDITAAERIAAALRTRNETSEIADAGRGAIAHTVEHVLRPALETLAESSENQDAVIAEMSTAIAEIAKVSESRLADEGYDTALPALRHCVDFLGHRAAEAGMSIAVAIGQVADEKVPEGATFGHIAFNLAKRAIACCSEGTSIELSYEIDPHHRGMVMRASNPSGTILSAATEQAADVLTDRIHALAARAGAILEVDWQEDGALAITCWFPTTQVGLPLVSDATAEALADANNVHELTPKLLR